MLAYCYIGSVRQIEPFNGNAPALHPDQLDSYFPLTLKSRTENLRIPNPNKAAPKFSKQQDRLVLGVIVH